MTRAIATASFAFVLHAFALAFRQLGDRRLLAVATRSLAITLALFLAVGIGLFFAIDAFVGENSGLAAIGALVAAIALFWLAFRAVAIAVIGLFGDAVVQAVEERDYPAALASARRVPLARAATMGLRSVARLVAYNLLATPLYLVTAVTGVGLPIAFFAINGWLLGRDLGDMVAVRHLASSQLVEWRARTRGRRFAIGLATSGLFVVPILNLLAPIIGAAAMTHLFHRERV